MDAKTHFEVTEKAGNWVAGRRSPGLGKTLLLTEEEAHHALMAGELRRPAAPAAKPSRKQVAPTSGGEDA